jgi:hypothetical protein
LIKKEEKKPKGQVRGYADEGKDRDVREFVFMRKTECIDF